MQELTPPYDDILEDETLAPLKRNHACLQVNILSFSRSVLPKNVGRAAHNQHVGRTNIIAVHPL